MKKTAKKTTAKRGRKKGGVLTVEFAGICCIVPDGAGGAEVLLPNVEKALQDDPQNCAPHHASLVVSTGDLGTVTGERTGPFAVSVPGNPHEYAVWPLEDTNVTFSQEDGLTIGRDVTDKVVNLKGLTNATGVTNTGPLITSSVVLRTGKMSTKDAPNSVAKIFFKGAKGFGTPTYYPQRCVVDIPFKGSITVTLRSRSNRQKAPRTLKFERDAKLLIGNVCAEADRSRNHFLAYYKLIKGPDLKRPEPAAQQPGGAREEDFVTPWCIIVLLVLL